MNTKLAFFFLLSFIIQANSLIFFFTYAAAAALSQSPIYDTDGDVVKPGVEYYIAFPVGFRGGIGLPATANFTCPASVIEMPSETQNGFPISFQPVDPAAREIHEGTTDLFIRFHDVKTGCPDGAAAWSVLQLVGTTSFVVAGPEVGTPSGQFKVVRDGTFNQYKFFHCRTIAWFQCGYVGLSRGASRNRLVVDIDGSSDDGEVVPLSIVFHKKQAANNAGMIQLPK